MHFIKGVLITLLVTTLSGCAFWGSGQRVQQNGSVVDYLYPNAKQPTAMVPGMTQLRPPVRVGIAFVPGGGWGNGPSEQQKMKLLERVKASFSQHAYIGSIEIIPSAYMQARGGFDNLDQVARMFNVEVVALLSYDQVQFNDTNRLSLLYWTIVGAYVINGNQYDIQTMLDASVFDVKSRKLLFRAPGTSRIAGNATMAGFSEKSRAAQTEGYNQAVDQLIPNLQGQLDNFREHLKSDSSIQITNKDGYRGGGAADWSWLALAAILAALVYGQRRRTR
ncbi:rhombotarget lipoprotein [Duganella qianjiadongensis]|uniref:Rhombotarget lipoprotein n=1 Tax=Duganella qianjiadongensis TaxID=2692176 RepID=A0ABW9VQG2_9BURK|nr:rhombotarget lipoprotein [Duganella qianjiadongensis]MYM40659.1 rhombotarget lipoprotein [Duganella qianjiadongensis]